METPILEALRKANIARAAHRRHRACKKHGDSRMACWGCGRVYCPQCGATCIHCGWMPDLHRPNVKRGLKPEQKPRTPYPATLHPIVAVLRPLGMIAVEPHPDSGHWQATFPYLMPGYASADQLSQALWPKIRHLAKPTPFGSGRLFKPNRWFISFELLTD